MRVMLGLRQRGGADGATVPDLACEVAQETREMQVKARKHVHVASG